MSRDRVLDLYFMENRAKLIDIAAFLDRFDRAEGSPSDSRMKAFRKAMEELQHDKPERAKRILLNLSDLTTEPRPSR